MLVDTGMHHPGSMADLERALDDVGLALAQINLILITHAHPDHWGQAGPVRDLAGCEVWMHPNYSHATASLEDPEAALGRRLEIGRQGGVSEAALERYLERVKMMGSGVAALIEPDHELTDGVVIDTDLGDWHVHETPGHAPSHVCFFQPERRLLISGDHLLGRVSLYFDYGYSPDPVGEFLRSLDVIEPLNARLCVSGHGRTFTDVRAHIDANRVLVARNLQSVLEALAGAPRTAHELVDAVFGGPLTPARAAWRMTETLCYLRHLEVTGRTARESDGVVERWRVL